jgi:hypothetical protein
MQDPTPADLERWLTEFPGCNWSLLTGRASGVVVIDVDPRNGANESMRKLVFPTTRTVMTPSWGWHFYYQCPAMGFPTIPSVRPGIDIKGDGGYVLIEPSVIDGVEYATVVDEPVAEPPDWVLASASPRGTNGNGTTTPARKWHKAFTAVAPGDQDNHLISLAGKLAQSLPPELWHTIPGTLATAAANYPETRRPWSEHDFIRIAESACGMEIRRKGIAVPTPDAVGIPEDGYVGIATDFAGLYSETTELPRSFLYMTFLTYLGVAVAHRVTLHSEMRPSPRLYTICLGASADTRKSSSINCVDAFFRDAIEGFGDYVHFGLGSAEGLARRLGRDPKTREVHPLIIHLDEARVLTDKARPEGSILLPMLATLFERTVFDNTTKTHTISIRDGYVALAAASTPETYASMWSGAFLDVGFTNRVWLVTGESERRIALPEPIPDDKRRDLASRLGDLLARVDQAAGPGQLALRLEPEAARSWETWYLTMPRSIHSRRLDTYGWRLMILLSLSRGDLETVSADTVHRVTALLDHQLTLRQRYDPVDAESTVARLEETIRRALRTRGPLTRRDLRRGVNADRYGLWMFETALSNLTRGGAGDVPDVRYDRASRRYAVTRDATADAPY